MLNRRGIWLRNLVENKGHAETGRLIVNAMREGEIKIEDISLLETAYGIMGPEWLARLAESNREGALMQNVPLLEAGATDSTAFSNITGQLMFSAVMEGYQNPMFIGDQLVTVTPTNFLDGERIPGIKEPDGTANDVGEGMPFPRVTMGEDYIDTPATTKKGLIVAITKEAILKDRTGLIVDRAKMVGERVGMRRETLILDEVLGITNTYNRLGTAYNTYLSAGGWINLITSGTELIDWTDIEEVELLFAALTNPDQTDDDEPVVYQPKTILVMPYKKHTAAQILTATSLERRTNSAAEVRISANSVSGYNMLSSPIAQARLVKSGVAAATARNYWYAGDFKRAFRYMQVYGLQVAQAPLNHPDEFDRDVVLQYKASERGIPVTVEPRYAAQARA